MISENVYLIIHFSQKAAYKKKKLFSRLVAESNFSQTCGTTQCRRNVGKFGGGQVVNNTSSFEEEGLTKTGVAFPDFPHALASAVPPALQPG